MDPVAHTLVGATLAETGLRRVTAKATPALLIGANLPDVDGIAMAWGRDAGLLFRRGWTHGVLAMGVLPLLLAGGLWAWHRWRPPRDGPPLRPGPLLGLCALGVWSHPLLDWLNTYGVRLLMPFSERWFYGDAVFIIDPWMWLMAGAAVVLAGSASRPSAVAWVVLATAASGLVLGRGSVPLVAKVVWLLGVGLVVAARLRRGPTPAAPRVALACIAGLALYVGAMLEGSAWARDQVTKVLGAEGLKPERLMVGALPARPFAREGVALAQGHYHLFEVDRLREEAVRRLYPPVPISGRDPVIDAALRSSSVRGFLGWVRFPHYTVEANGDGHRVWLRDLRYATPEQQRGFGITTVELGPGLKPR